jgi:peptidoglycan/xylan/chitin deacetylase (PgdA/CDA1 family)
MPGGYMSRKYYNDPNLKEFDNVLNQKGMYSIDWNALSGDAQGKRKNKNELLQFLKNSISNKKQIVILIHDTYGRESSAEALPVMIDYLKSQGYEFKTIE